MKRIPLWSRMVGSLVCCAALLQGHTAFADDDAPARTVLKVAVYHDFAPFSSNRQKPQGIDVDIAAALARKLKLPLQLLPFDAGEELGDDLRNMVWKGHYLGYGPADVMLHVPLDPRLSADTPQVTFFGPYFRETIMLGIDTRRLETVVNLSDLVGRPLCATVGEAGAAALFGAAGGKLVPQVRLEKELSTCTKLMIEGKVDAIAARRAELESLLEPLGKNLRLVAIESPVIPPAGWRVGMAIKKSNDALGEQLARALDELRTSGELSDIFQRHHVTFVSP